MPRIVPIIGEAYLPSHHVKVVLLGIVLDLPGLSLCVPAGSIVLALEKTILKGQTIL